MKKFLKVSLLLMSLALIIVLSACGGKSEQSVSQNKGWPKGVSVTSAPLGGTFNVYAIGWAEIMSDKLGVNMNVEATDGPISNIELVDRGDAEIGMVTMGPAYEAFHGFGWADKKYQNFRMLFPMYVSYLHWFSMPHANINSIYDIEGKIIGTGASGGTPDYYTQKIFQELNIKPRRIVNGSFSDYANQMRDGQMDIAGVFAPAGHPTITEMIHTDNVKVLGVGELSKELANKFNITSGILPAGSYEGQTEDIETLTIYSAFIVHKDLPDDFVYELVKTTYESKQELINVHKSAEELLLDNVPEGIGSLPIHPGAIKYFEENGVKLPDTAYPENYD